MDQAWQLFNGPALPFRPGSPRTALEACLQGLLPESAYLNRAVNLRPAFEEPWDLQEFDQLLAQPDLDPNLLGLLMQVFARMLAGRDKELALYAAESISLVEGRFSRKLRAAEQQLDQALTRENRLAVLHTRLAAARLYTPGTVQRRHHLQQALNRLWATWKALPPQAAEIQALVELQLGLDRPATALRLLEKFLQNHPEEVGLKPALLPLYFRQRRFADLNSLLDELQSRGQLDPDRALFWLAGGPA